jgi:hypothetical protein
VRNTGNASIENFDFSLTLPGPHLLAIAQATSTNDKLWKSITIHYPDMFSKGDQQFQVSVPFFDPGEGFRISTFSNGAPTLCEVSCRVKGVIVHIVTQDTLDTRVRRQATYASLLGAALAISLAFLSFILSYAKLNDAAEITKRLQLDQFKELQKKTTPSPQ